MTLIHRSLCCTAAALLLSACATAPHAQDICSPEWIAPRLDQAVERIEDRLETSLAALADAGESWMRGKSPGPVQLFRLSNAAKRFETELKDGRGMQDLRRIANSCNDPDLIRSQIYALLERQNVSDEMIGFLEGTGIMEQIIRTAEGERPAAPQS